MKKPLKFRTFQQFNRCAKAWALLTVYHNTYVETASEEFCNAMFYYVDRELRRMALPEGWNRYANYDEFVEWFIKNT